MNQLDALRWLEKQAGLKIIIGKDKHVTLTDGMTVETSDVGILNTVVKLQKIIKGIQNGET
jgi:hypothetical protein